MIKVGNNYINIDNVTHIEIVTDDKGYMEFTVHFIGGWTLYLAGEGTEELNKFDVLLDDMSAATRASVNPPSN